MQIKKYVYRKLLAFGVLSFAFYLAMKAVFSYWFFVDFQNEQARYLSTIVADSLRPPVIQGSLVETKIRLDAMKDNRIIECAILVMADNRLSNCPTRETWSRREIAADIYFDESTKKNLAARVRILPKASSLESYLVNDVTFNAAVIAFLIIAFVYTFQTVISRLWKEIRRLMNWREESAANPFFFVETRRLAQDFERLLHNLAEKERLAVFAQISQFLGHDLRAPLSSIESLLFLPADTPIAQQKPGIQEALRRLHSMIDSLRHMDTESLVRPQPSSLSFGQARMGLLDRARGRGVSIVFPDDLPDLVRIDAEKFERAWINLASNAIEAAKTEVQIKLSIQAHELRLQVIDDGPGVAPQIQARIFQRGVTHGKKDGTGLGLAYTRQIMQGHGGDVVYRREGGYTIFECILPHVLYYEDQDLSDARAVVPPAPPRRKVSIVLLPSDLNDATLSKLGGIMGEKFDCTGHYSSDADLVFTNVDHFVQKAMDICQNVIELKKNLSPQQAFERIKARLELEG